MAAALLFIQKIPDSGSESSALELLARFVCIRARECARIKVRLRRAVAGGAHPRRI